MVQQFSLGGHIAWLKRYEADGASRRLLVRVWNALVTRLGITPLRSPPRYVGEDAKIIEHRRIEVLRACGATVPDILGEGPASLILSDMGPTLASQLKKLPASQRDELVEQTARAIGDLHARGGYLGQAFARNITVGPNGVGFIDFEDDPGEVMSLPQAQARDWILFAAGMGKHYRGRVDFLARILARTSREADAEVISEVESAVKRLGFVRRIGRFLGRGARDTASSVAALARAFGSASVLALMVDVMSDGDCDLWMGFVAALQG
ncbi:tRNA A-37 threonylcarbamoyl transferase component Bud32 [Luteibacter sp. Sphag1AF]|uniref:serine/threonine protein phosphatase n=1 Tax=Luteibacter sp. Sphag1AF TaxID=2587031 RepID=UPI001621E190|nr:serine/threonine protein phosphatase [Luteibacter sp. Sphag1AF]MBB3226529.1 tRNA A-37 threonylcarbamoyl transferase component Bud32 [Luteibacter sp. Sphag1AF]